MDERLPIVEYFRRLAHSLDGQVWLGICVISLVASADLLLGNNSLPLRERHDMPKAISLLAWSPLLTFSALVVARLLPFSRNRLAVFARALFVAFFFALINF